VRYRITLNEDRDELADRTIGVPPVKEFDDALNISAVDLGKPRPQPTGHPLD
jgi:hypothetical protein